MNERMHGFSGFAAGKQPTTAVPNAFFTDLLPAIDNLAELKVTLHLFWLIAHKRGALRYARLSELMGDERLLNSLAMGALSGETVLRDGLERATARGALLHAIVHRGELREDWFMINSAHGRTVLEKLQSGELDLRADVAEDIQLQVDRSNIFVLYEQNIGLLTPMIADELRDAEKQYAADWIEDAFREAVSQNKRTWRYVQRILDRWARQGRGPGATDKAPATAPERPDGKRKYVPEGYEDLIEH